MTTHGEEREGFLRYGVGDATRLAFGGCSRKYLVHVVNCAGRWGAGFSGAVSKRWPFVETTYRRYWRKYRMGDVQQVSVGGRATVVNLFGQANVRTPRVPKPISYGAVRKGLDALGRIILKRGGTATVHMPRIGCGLAGGDWEEVRRIVVEELVERRVRVYVYDLPGKGSGA